MQVNNKYKNFSFKLLNLVAFGCEELKIKLVWPEDF